MNSFVKIPVAGIFEFDDVGWDLGRDQRHMQRASRSGLPRYHAQEDYEMLARVSEALGVRIPVALCLADWDKDNFLRGEVGITHDPYGWNRAAEIDIEKFSKYRDTIDNAPYIDYCIHGLMHGVYGEDGKLISETEYFRLDTSDGQRRTYLPSLDELVRRLDLFYKIYNSWGFKKPIRSFISPCGMDGISDEDIDIVTKELYKRGIRYWFNGGFCFEGSMAVRNGVAIVKKRNMKTSYGDWVPWDAYDLDPLDVDLFAEQGLHGYNHAGLSAENPSCMFGMHWTNLLRFNPKRNFEDIGRWVEYLERNRAVFGFVAAKCTEEAVNQHFYCNYAKMDVADGVISIDLCGIEDKKLDCHIDEFFISFKNDSLPTSCEGGEMSVYEEMGDFTTYKIKHSGSYVKIKV